MRLEAATLLSLLALTAVVVEAQPPNVDPDPKLQRHCNGLDVLRDEHGQVVWLSHERMKAMAVKKVTPVLPPMLRQARVQGSVLVSICVGPDGVPIEAWAVQGHPMLVGSILQAASQWRFKPYLVKSKPIPFAGTLTFAYSNGFQY